MTHNWGKIGVKPQPDTLLRNLLDAKIPQKQQKNGGSPHVVYVYCVQTVRSTVHGAKVRSGISPTTLPSLLTGVSAVRKR